MLKARKARVKGRWIFQAEGGKPEGHFLRKFKAIAKRAGLNCGACKTKMMDGKYHLRKLTDVTCETRPVCEKHYLHRLRKTAATRWLHNGINIRKIQSWLGHSSLEVTQLYLDDVSPNGDEEQAKIDKAGGSKPPRPSVSSEPSLPLRTGCLAVRPDARGSRCSLG